MPAPSLAQLVDPRRTAVVTQECQGAIVGLDAGLRELAAEAQREAIPNIARLLDAARAAGVAVVHCTVQRREDGLGSNHNSRLFSVNVAITNFVMDAVNQAYDFVLPRDAVAGIPREYAEAVIDNTLSLLATVTTTDALIETWAP